MFPQPTQNYTVMVVSLTYNHAPYIEETLKGIIMQQTYFSVVACVLDDCSTDGTADIIRKYEAQYPDLIKGFYFKENQYSQGKKTPFQLKSWVGKVKYIAMCEGDDYWTDPLKLQKQVDFMESRTNCNICFHNVMEHWQDGSSPDKMFFPVENRAYSGTEIFKNWIVATASVMLRANSLQSQDLEDILKNKDLMYYDQAIFMYCASVGEIWGMSDVMAVYRRLSNGYSENLRCGLKTSPDVIWRFCKHNKAMADLFGNKLGNDFRREAISRFVSVANCSIRVLLRNFDFRHSIFLFSKSLYIYPKETIFLYLEYLKKIVS